MEFNFNDVLLLVKNKKFNEALEFLEKLIKKDQNNFEYHHLKGTIHFNLDELNDAILCFSKTIKINEKNFNMYYLRGAAYTNQGKYTEAKLDFEKAIFLKNNFSEAYFGLGVLYSKKNENLLAIKNYLKSIELNDTFKPPVIQLIKILTRTKNINNHYSAIISKHNEINKLNFNIKYNEHIRDESIYNLVSTLNNILQNNFENLNFGETQIYRRNKLDLNCKRHKKIFNMYSVIPKFCFGCYKIQIEPQNIIDLIKLYLIFDNIELRDNNTRKCMVEKRSNVNGYYKGLIYCNSYEEAKNIFNYINDFLIINFNKKFKINIKKGCSEYAVKYENYNSFETDSLSYKNEWSHFENLIDTKFDHLKDVKEGIPTIKGITLNDALIINNWLSYAKSINDNSLKL